MQRLKMSNRLQQRDEKNSDAEVEQDEEQWDSDTNEASCSTILDLMQVKDMKARLLEVAIVLG